MIPEDFEFFGLKLHEIQWDWATAIIVFAIGFFYCMVAWDEFMDNSDNFISGVIFSALAGIFAFGLFHIPFIWHYLFG